MNIKRVDYSKEFLKRFKKAPLEIKTAFRKRFEIFLKDPFYPFLDNHALTGEYSGYRSINITGDWRLIFSEYEEDDGKIIQLKIIGTHSKLYG